MATDDLITVRYGCAAVSLENSLYVFGGMDGNVPLNTVEVYEPRMDTWTDSPPMYYEVQSVARTSWK